MSASGQTAAPMGQRGNSALRQILVSFFTLVVCALFLKFGGLLVSMAISHRWSADQPVPSAYAFVVRWVIMVFVYPSVLNLVRPAFIPLYNEIRKEAGDDAAMGFARGVLEIGLLFGSAIAVLMWTMPGVAVRVMAPDFSVAQAAATIRLMRLVAPGLFLLLWAEMYLILFHAERKFAYPHGAEALQKILWGLGIVVGSVVLHWEEAAVGVAYTVACGVQLAVSIVGMKRTFGWALCTTPLRQWSQRWGGRLWVLVLPLLVGMLGARIRDLVSLVMQSGLDAVRFVSVEYAKQLVNVPAGFLGTLVAMVMLPHLSALLHAEGKDSHRDVLQGAVETISLLSIPVMSVCLVSAPQMMSAVFLKSLAADADFQTCAQGALAIRMIALGFTFAVLENILLPGLFSIKSMWWPNLWGIASNVFQVAYLALLAALALPRDSALLLAGVAFAYPASRIFKNGILLLVLRRKTGIFPQGRFALFVSRMAGLAVATVGLNFAYRYGTEWILNKASVSSMLASTAEYLVNTGLATVSGGIGLLARGGVKLHLAADLSAAGALHAKLLVTAVFKATQLLLLGLPSVLTVGSFVVLTWFGGYREQMQDVIRTIRAGRKGGRPQVVLPEA